MDIKTTKIYEDETYIINKIEITTNDVLETLYVKLNKITNISFSIEEPINI